MKTNYFYIFGHYLWYVIRHKWFVFVEACKYGIPLRGIVHDWHKFLPDEMIPYAMYFNHPLGGRHYDKDKYLVGERLGMMFSSEHKSIVDNFNRAWLKHQKRAPHHWQHWIMHEDDGDVYAMEMPKSVAKEMLCDWHGAGRAIVGKNSDTKKWYLESARDTIMLHPNTREWVESELGIDFQE